MPDIDNTNTDETDLETFREALALSGKETIGDCSSDIN